MGWLFFALAQRDSCFQSIKPNSFQLFDNLLRQRVSEYVRWKEAFDSSLAVRQAGTPREVLVLRNIEDQQEIITILGWHDLRQARLFS